MHKPISPAADGGLRKRFIEDMAVRGFTEKTRRSYTRIVSGFAAFLSRSPDTATAKDIRRFQVHQSKLGMHAPGMIVPGGGMKLPRFRGVLRDLVQVGSAVAASLAAS